MGGKKKYFGIEKISYFGSYMDPCNWLITLYLLTGRLFLLFGFIWFRDSSIIFLSGLGTAALFFFIWFRDSSIIFLSGFTWFRDSSLIVLSGFICFRDSSIILLTGFIWFRDSSIFLLSGFIWFRDSSIILLSSFIWFRDSIMTRRFRQHWQILLQKREHPYSRRKRLDCLV